MKNHEQTQNSNPKNIWITVKKFCINAFVNLIEIICEALEQNLSSMLLSYDLEKDFDTVKYQNFISKREK